MLVAKASLVTVISTSCVTYQFHEPIKRVVGNLLHRDVMVENGFFKDPNGLYVDVGINEDGDREAYLMHGPTGKRVAVLEDMYGRTEGMLESVLNRSDRFSSEEARRYLPKLNLIEESLYRRLNDG